MALWIGMSLQQQRRQPFRREPVHGVHRQAVAVGVDQLLVDPRAAASPAASRRSARASRASPGAACRRSRSDRCRCRESRSRCGSPGAGAACPGARASPTTGCSAASPGCSPHRQPPRRSRPGTRVWAIRFKPNACRVNSMLWRDERLLAHELVRLDDEASRRRRRSRRSRVDARAPAAPPDQPAHARRDEPGDARPSRAEQQRHRHEQHAR